MKTRISVLMVCLMIFFSNKIYAHHEENDHGDGHGSISVVATVGDMVITKNDINDDGTRTTAYLIKRLSNKIKEIIYNNTAKEFKIDVSDDEVQKRWNSITKNAGSPMDEGARIGLRATITEEKLDQVIYKEMAEKDGDFAEYLRLSKRVDPDVKKISEIKSRFEKRNHTTVINYVSAQKYLWWEKRYKEAKVRILDPDLKSAINLVKP
ncbi:MAG TPA: hypothetical protein VHE12_11170 [bacterium]|nr:hypothetical protein [bacterium]